MRRRLPTKIDGKRVTWDRANEGSNVGPFVTLTWAQINTYLGACSRESSAWVVYASLINACRTTRSRTVRFSSKWYQHADLSRSTVQRALHRLEAFGLISQQFEGKKVRVVTLLNAVPLPEVDKSGAR